MTCAVFCLCRHIAWHAAEPHEADLTFGLKGLAMPRNGVHPA